VEEMTDDQAIEELESYLKPESITGISYDCARHSLQVIETLALIKKAWNKTNNVTAFHFAVGQLINHNDIRELKRLVGEE
jgi:hypothetical protein